MMAFLIGVAVGLAVGAGVAVGYRVVRYAQWQHTLIAYAATISRLHARWIITDTLGTFEGHPMEDVVAFLHRYSTSRTTRTTPRSTPRSTTPDATEER